MVVTAELGLRSDQLLASEAPLSNVFHVDGIRQARRCMAVPHEGEKEEGSLLGVRVRGASVHRMKRVDSDSPLRHCDP